MSEDIKTVSISLSKEELSIITYALASSLPFNKEQEVIQFKLYHRLLFKMNDLK